MPSATAKIRQFVLWNPHLFDLETRGTSQHFGRWVSRANCRKWNEMNWFLATRLFSVAETAIGSHSALSWLAIDFRRKQIDPENSQYVLHQNILTPVAWLTSRVQAQMHARDSQLPPERSTASGQLMSQHGTLTECTATESCRVQTCHHVRSHQTLWNVKLDSSHTRRGIYNEYQTISVIRFWGTPSSTITNQGFSAQGPSLEGRRGDDEMHRPPTLFSFRAGVSCEHKQLHLTTRFPQGSVHKGWSPKKWRPTVSAKDLGVLHCLTAPPTDFTLSKNWPTTIRKTLFGLLLSGVTSWLRPSVKGHQFQTTLIPMRKFNWRNKQRGSCSFFGSSGAEEMPYAILGSRALGSWMLQIDSFAKLVNQSWLTNTLSWKYLYI
jgi:hypothetical protein